MILGEVIVLIVGCVLCLFVVEIRGVYWFVWIVVEVGVVMDVVYDKVGLFDFGFYGYFVYFGYSFDMVCNVGEILVG